MKDTIITAVNELIGKLEEQEKLELEELHENNSKLSQELNSVLETNKQLIDETSLVQSRLISAESKIASADIDLCSLQQQVSAKAAELKAEKHERAARDEQVKDLERKLAGLKDERDAHAKEKGVAQQAVEQLQQQVAAKAAELKAEKHERVARDEQVKDLEREIVGLKNEQNTQAKERGEMREESELTLLQLHKVQEELQHYFEKFRHTEKIATAQKNQLVRAQSLMARLLTDETNLAPSQHSEIEILTISPINNKLQTEALLNSYAASLSRAYALLRRTLQR